METDIDIQSDMGRFGWEELIGGVVIPYIVRGNKKFSSREIFTKHVARNFYNNLNDVDLLEFEGLQIHRLTQIESYLMNEINHLHCESLYDHSFKIDDPLLEIGDIGEMAQFFHDCHQKLNRGDEYDLKNGGILNIRIKKNGRRYEFRVPYVRVDCILYVPINKCEFYKGTPKQSIKLTGINLQYMKFMHKVLQLRVDNIGPCMPFEEIRDALSSTAQIKVTEYWPKDDLSNRFYLSTIPTFSVDDESPPVSEHETPWSCEMSRTGQQMPPTVVSTNQQQITANTNEPSAQANQLAAVSEDESPWSCEMPTARQQIPPNVASPNQQQNTTTINEPRAEANQLAVVPEKKKREIDENGNAAAVSMGSRTRKRVKLTVKSKSNDNKKTTVSAIRPRNILLFCYYTLPPYISLHTENVL